MQRAKQRGRHQCERMGKQNTERRCSKTRSKVCGGKIGRDWFSFFFPFLSLRLSATAKKGSARKKANRQCCVEFARSTPAEEKPRRENEHRFTSGIHRNTPGTHLGEVRVFARENLALCVCGSSASDVWQRCEPACVRIQRASML